MCPLIQDDPGMPSPAESSGSADNSRQAASSDPRIWIFRVLLVVALVARVGYWIATERVWEDALITVRHAENAAAGHGMTHHPAQGIVHGFTSPLSVLIPLAGESLVPTSGILVLRVSSLLATVVVLWLGFRIATHPLVDLSAASTFFFLGYLAIEYHQVMFGMAGMETEWIVAITLFGVLSLLRDQPVWMGLACGAAMWGRPDGVVMVLAILVTLGLAWRWKAMGVVVLVGLLVVAPWIVFCELYYGSFVPHTIVAKDTSWSVWSPEQTGAQTYLGHWGSLIASRFDLVRLWFSPVYAGCGGPVNFIRGARPVQFVYLAIAIVGALLTLRRASTRIIAVYSGGFLAYLLLVLAIPSPWYLPPWLAVVALCFALGIDALRGSNPQSVRSRLGAFFSLGLLGLYAFAFLRAVPADAILQRDVEDQVRKPIGIWLNEQCEPDQWISCECLGYFGYYSRRPMLDYPGLSSPRSVNALQTLPPGERSLQALIAAERPEWLALRPHEWAQLQEEFPEVSLLYEEVHRRAASDTTLERLGEWLWVDGRSILIDEEFLVLRRHDIASEPSR